MINIKKGIENIVTAFINKASAELIAATFIMCADMVFIYKCLPYRLFFDDELLEFYSLIGFVQVIVFAIVLRLFQTGDYKFLRKEYTRRIEMELSGRKEEKTPERPPDPLIRE